MKTNTILLLLLLIPMLALAQHQWQEMAPPPVPAGSFAISKANNYFYMGSYNDGLYRSTDKGASWQRVYHGPTDKSFYAVAVREADGAVFAGGVGAMYRSLDHGTTWTKHSLATTAAVTHIAFNSAGDIYVGTQDIIPTTFWPHANSGAGVFKANAHSTTWTEINAGLEGTSKSIAALQITHNDRLYIGVHDGNMDETGGVFTRGNGELIWQKKPLQVQYGQTMATVTPFLIYDMALDGMGGVYVAAEGLRATAGVPSRVACRVLAKSSDAGTTWHTASVITNPAGFDLEPVPQQLFLAGASSLWTATLLGQIIGDHALSGIYMNRNSEGWNRPAAAQLATAFRLIFAEDAQDNLYAMEDFNAKLYKAASVTSTKDELPATAVEVYPNPASTQINAVLDISSTAPVQVAVLDALGRTVKVLAQQPLPTGRHTLTWNTAESPTGIYFIKCQVKDKSSVHRVVVVK